MMQFFKSLTTKHSSSNTESENKPLLKSKKVPCYSDESPKLENYVLKINIADSCNLLINKSSFENASKIIEFIKSFQDSLSMDDGFEPDFTVEKIVNDNIQIFGNLKTSLIVLRHMGFISPEETENLINIVENKLLKETSKFNQYASILKKYEENYQIAVDRFADSASPVYHSKIVLTF